MIESIRTRVEIIFRACLLFLLCSASCLGQITNDQKAADLTQLAAMFAKNYGPIQWKRDTFHFDLLDIKTFLDRAAATQSDLEFYDLCVEYISMLDDAHSGFYLPSDFVASLPISVDIYDGKVVVDAILAPSKVNIPLRIGDELLAVDGVLANDLINSFSKYSALGNPASTRRVAALRIVSRPQQIMPWASTVPDMSQVTVRHSDGGIDTFLVDWAKRGLPLTVLGPVISPGSAAPASAAQALLKRARGALSETGDDSDPLAKLHTMELPSVRAVNGFGRTSPVFTLPANFSQRLGGPSDFFYSGTFVQNGYRIGYIRIPSFSGISWSGVFYNEIRHMKAVTDGLILDIMRNPGGDACFAQELLRQVIPYPFRMVGLEVRASRQWLVNFQQALASAESSGASQEIVDQYRVIVNAVQAAYLTPSGRSTPIPVCSPSLDIRPEVDGNNVATGYDKPIVLLTDEFSASAADLFAAVFQDARRGVVFGTRTMGAGGNVGDFPNVTTYSGGEATITESLMVRKAPVRTTDFGLTAYIENVGVRPDVIQDYMTMDNLMNGGHSFVRAFTNTLIGQIESRRMTAGTDRVSQRQSTPASTPGSSHVTDRWPHIMK